MSIKTFKPTTPSRRHMTVNGFDGIDKHVKPEASLTEVLKKNAGRNSYGRITVRHRGGGEKRKYRIIDFKRDKVDMPAEVLRLEYDPNRSANIALVQYEDGEKRYIIAPVGLSVGDKVLSSAAADIKPGNCLPIANIPVGTVIHNIEMHPGKGAQLVRSAGAFAQLMAKEGSNAQVRMPSGEVRIIRLRMGPGVAKTWVMTSFSGSMLKLFSALAHALLRSFMRGSEAALGVCIRIAMAVLASLPRIRSQTIWILRGEMRTYFR